MRIRPATALGLACLVALAACGDPPKLGPFTPTPPPPQEQALSDIPFAEIVAGSFGEQGLSERGGSLAAADGATYRLLGRLTGHLQSAAAMTQAAFIDHRPGAPDRRPAGVYVTFVSMDEGGQPRYDGPSVLTASRDGIEPEGSDAKPFRQGSESVEGVTSISPSLVLDLHGDGLEEMALLVRTRRRGVSFEHYDVYERDAESGWRRASGAVDAPGLAALQYWASVGAAAAIARGWEPEERLRIVWPWLAVEGAAVEPEVVSGLVPDGDPEKIESTQEALIFLRAFFDDAHKRFSQGFQVRQPWPAFINGFKAAEGVELISVSPPELTADGSASVEVILDLTQREGDASVVRRYLVETETVQEGAEWYLDGVSASEQRA